MELLLGCGHSRDKKVWLPGRQHWDSLITLDRYEECEPDVVWDLENLPYPWDHTKFDEIHAYCVLEHLGRQGDWRFFFDQFTEFARIIRPGGTFHAITPHYTSAWAWGDPSHVRIVGAECLNFLNQDFYKNIEEGFPISDFRWYYKADWKLISQQVLDNGQFAFVLRCQK